MQLLDDTAREAMNDLALAAFACKDFDRALDAFGALDELGALEPVGRIALAVTLCELGRDADGRQHYEAVRALLEAKPADSPWHGVLAGPLAEAARWVGDGPLARASRTRLRGEAQRFQARLTP